MAAMETSDNEEDASLAQAWFDLDGMPERGAGGRLIVAPSKLVRRDLDFNWDVVGTAMKKVGARAGVDQLQEDVELFFEKSRPKGKKPVTSYLARIAWIVQIGELVPCTLTRTLDS